MYVRIRSGGTAIRRIYSFSMYKRLELRPVDASLLPQVSRKYCGTQMLYPISSSFEAVLFWLMDPRTHNARYGGKSYADLALSVLFAIDWNPA